jgi:glucose-6-phosphate isomerase
VLQTSDDFGVDRQQSAEIIRLLQKSNKNNPGLSRMMTKGDRSAQLSRFESFSRVLDGILLDFARTSVDAHSLDLLIALATSAGLESARDQMFSGHPVNHTENRPVLHHLWRHGNFSDHLDPGEADSMVSAMSRMTAVAESLSGGRLPLVEGDSLQESDAAPIRHIVHIGIGGSLLGPQMLCQAMPKQPGSPDIHFLSSADAHDRDRLLGQIDPRETAVILVSKSFTTSEVLLHGQRLLDWMAPLGRSLSQRRLFAVTSASLKAEKFGVPAEQVFPMGEWTGGRFSLWSPVSLSAAIFMGGAAFAEIRRGGASMDEHFRTAPFADNLPVLMGCLRIWHRNICGYQAQGCIPYDSRLKGIPGWLQQLEMESTGKSVQRDGRTVSGGTSPIVVGDCGTDAQHALFQAFHQGTTVVPLDFIAAINPGHGDLQAHQHLLSHLLAQATAFAVGRDAQAVEEMLKSRGHKEESLASQLPHHLMPGDRPSSIILLDQLDPFSLGQLLVLYEHMVFVSSVIWNVNAFDQWGVELGKAMADKIEPMLKEHRADASANGASETMPDGIEAPPGLEGIVGHIRNKSRN